LQARPNHSTEVSSIIATGVSPSEKPKNRRKTIMHETFRAGITIKGIDGLLEAVGGLLLWFVKPSSIRGVVAVLLHHELSRDPNDFIAQHILHASEHFTDASKPFASAYLLTHGLVKALLVTALWFDELWAYPFTIAVFAAFSFYQIYRFAHTHSWALALLTVFDVLIIYLTWEEYREQKSIRHR
jgi:uncharacterized membrane protein